MILANLFLMLSIIVSGFSGIINKINIPERNIAKQNIKENKSVVTNEVVKSQSSEPQPLITEPLGYIEKFDLTKDGKIDFADISVLTKHYGLSDLPEGDYNNNGIVDNEDMEEFKEHCYNCNIQPIDKSN